MREFITEEQFKRLAKESPGVGIAGKGLRKQVLEEIEKGGGKSERSLTFTISTATVDRQSDTVSLEGWDFENYLKNPVVLWAHDYHQLPIASASRVWKYGNNIKAAADFVPADMPVIGAFAEAVFQMYKGGFLNATSVGFLPKKWKWAEEDARPYGIDFEEQELLEFSAVPVPANPEALLEAKSAGIDIEPIRNWAKAILKGEAKELAQAVAESLALTLPERFSPPISPGKTCPSPLLRRELEVLRLR